MNAYTKQRLGIAEKKPKGLWVKAKDIMNVTGWNKEEMRRARIYGWIEWKKENGFFYNFDSIPQQLIKQSA